MRAEVVRGRRATCLFGEVRPVRSSNPGRRTEPDERKTLPMTAQTTSTAGFALIQDYEGFRAEPAQMPNGAWLVGHGHERAEAGEPVREADALNLLSVDLTPIEGIVNALVTQRLTQSQFDALVSFAFSIGAEAFVQSQVLRRLNAGEYIAAACAMDAWRKGEVAGELEVIEALVRRRTAEKAMFLRDMPRTTAPSALVRAKLDHAASVLGAPMKFASVPEIACAPVASKPEEREQLDEILKSEPQTEELLLTQVVPNVVFEEAEIATTHAEPAARPIPFVELPVDRRIRDGETRGVSAALKSMWRALRTLKPQQA